MLRPVPALLALCSMGALPALEISDNDAKVTIGLFAQVVAAKASASDSSGSPYNATEGQPGKSDDVDFYLRRFRPYLRGTYKGFGFEATFQGDGWGRATSAANTGSTAFGLFQGLVNHTWKGDITHTVSFGKQAPWFNRAHLGPITHMFAANRASTSYIAPLGVGVGYRMVAPYVSLGLDVQNNLGDDTTSQAGGPAEGMLYTARMELTGKNADSWNIDGWKESFAGKAGKGVALGIEVAANQKNRTTTTASQTLVVAGIDLLFHFDGLTALAEFRTQETSTRTITPGGSKTTIDGNIFLAQAGYAFPVAAIGGFLEPALRFQSIDNNTDNDKEGASYGFADWGASGIQIDAQVTWYLAGHNNKLALLFSEWRGEEGTAASSSEPRAHIVRLQHQFNF